MEIYRITYRMECFVEAADEDKAKQAFQNGEEKNIEFVEVVSVEKVDPDGGLSFSV